MGSKIVPKHTMDIEFLQDLLNHKVLIESLSEGFAVVDEKNELTYINARFREMLEYTNEEIWGHITQDFLKDENLRIQRENIQKERIERYQSMSLSGPQNQAV